MLQLSREVLIRAGEGQEVADLAPGSAAPSARVSIERELNQGASASSSSSQEVVSNRQLPFEESP